MFVSQSFQGPLPSSPAQHGGGEGGQAGAPLALSVPPSPLCPGVLQPVSVSQHARVSLERPRVPKMSTIFTRPGLHSVFRKRVSSLLRDLSDKDSGVQEAEAGASQGEKLWLLPPNSTDQGPPAQEAPMPGPRHLALVSRRPALWTSLNWAAGSVPTPPVSWDSHSKSDLGGSLGRGGDGSASHIPAVGVGFRGKQAVYRHGPESSRPVDL